MNVRSEPSGTRPSETRPSGTGPSQARSSEARSSEARSSETRSSETRSSETRSSEARSSGAGRSAALERQLLECHAALRRLEESCEVPAVRAAARTALAELRAALDSQAVDFPFFSLPAEADGPRRGEPVPATGTAGGGGSGGHTVEYATEHAGAA